MSLVIPDLLSCLPTQPDSIVSRTLHSDTQSKVVVFGFSAGQELSEHTASVPAVMHFLAGEAEVLVGVERVTASAGTWIRMEAKLPHAITARTPVVMLLTMFKAAGAVAES
ncbi:cupin domain-containing protein [Nibricoccus sp. IMCC34717]|uniref:cupin domain-containing protein n=1 Tax=Nibricoccus sp. IMCC34717 TaxID=3034021 RepID=UPI00384CC954